MTASGGATAALLSLKASRTFLAHPYVPVLVWTRREWRNALRLLRPTHWGSRSGRMSIEFGKIVDISLELDPKNFAMRTPAGFTKDMQFEMEVIKEHDAPGGAGQIVRGVHMRLHAGSHVDAPEHNVRGGTQIHQLAARALHRRRRRCRPAR